LLGKRNIKAIVIGGSAGSFPVALDLLSALPTNFSVPIIFAMHRLKHIKNGFVEALQTKSTIEVKEPYDKDKVKPGFAYVAPANYHLMIELAGTFSLSTEEMVHHSRPSIDILFKTAGYVYGKNMIGIMLSGANKDGAEGIFCAHKKGAYTIIQDPADSKVPTMPNAAINLFKPDLIADANAIIKFISTLH